MDGQEGGGQVEVTSPDAVGSIVHSTLDMVRESCVSFTSSSSTTPIAR